MQCIRCSNQESLLVRLASVTMRSTHRPDGHGKQHAKRLQPNTPKRGASNRARHDYEGRLSVSHTHSTQSFFAPGMKSAVVGRQGHGRLGN